MRTYKMTLELLGSGNEYWEQLDTLKKKDAKSSLHETFTYALECEGWYVDKLKIHIKGKPDSHG